MKQYLFKIILNSQFLILNLFCLTAFSFSQNRTISGEQSRIIDSLKLALKSRLLSGAKHDSVKCSILLQLSEIASKEEWPKYIEELKNLAERNIKFCSTGSNLYKFYLKCISSSLNDAGLIYYSHGEVDSALNNFEKSLKISVEIGDKDGESSTLHNFALIYNNKGDVQQALEYYGRSLKLSEETGDKKGVAITLNIIGAIQREQGDIAMSLEYHKKSLKISEEIGYKTGIAEALNDIGYSYFELNDVSKALDAYTKSLKIYNSIGDKSGIAAELNNIGFVYYANRDPNCIPPKSEKCGLEGIRKALEYFNENLRIVEGLNEKDKICSALKNLGGIYYFQKKYDKALPLALRSLQISYQLGYPDNISSAAELLLRIYKARGDFKNALQNYELYILMRDSINNEKTKKASIKSQLKYEYEKKAATDSIKNMEEKKVKDAEIVAQGAKLKQEKTQFWFLITGLVFVLAGLIFAINRFRVTQKQKKIIEEQKIKVDEAFKHLDEKNMEVMDSIRYAKRIQTALITSEKYIDRKLNVLIR